MSYGKLTEKVAHALRDKLEPCGWRVLFDLGKQGIDPSENLGKIVSWCRDDGKDIQLAFLDIAIVERTTEKVVALFEIEESTAKPKVLLGDVLATLLGDRITFRGKQSLRIGKWTRLVVLARKKHLILLQIIYTSASSKCDHLFPHRTILSGKSLWTHSKMRQSCKPS